MKNTPSCQKNALALAVAIAASFFLTSAAIAGGLEVEKNSPCAAFYAGAYAGYGNIQGAYEQDGNFAQGRLAMGLHFNEYKRVRLGGELGLQSGTNLRLSADQTLIDAAGGLPIQANLRPLLDLLFVINGKFTPESLVYYIIKGGIAYRQLVLMDRSSSQDSLNKVAGEFQAGLGFAITPRATVTLLYQGIYAENNAGVYLDSSDNVAISHIPTQQAGFLGFEYSFV